MKTKITIITAFLFLGINISFGQWVELSPTLDGVEKIDCIDGTHCFLGSFGTVKKTIDGNNWIDVSPNANNTVPYLKMFSIDTCYLRVGGSSFFRTYDGGLNWDEQILGTTVPKFFLNPNIGFGIELQGKFFKSTDKGFSWVQMATLPSDAGNIMTVFFEDENIGFVGTHNGSNKINIYKTINSGATWTKVYEKNTTSLVINEIVSFSNGIGFACGFDGLLLKTTDGGDSWTQLNHPFTSLSNLNLKSLDFINPSSGYVVGTQNVIMKTIDGGDSWIDESYPSGVMEEVSVASLDTVYIGAFSPIKLLKTTSASLILKIKEEDLEIGSIYPNPTNSVVNISIIEDNCLVELYDVSGKLIISQALNVNVNNQIDLLQMESGLYVYKIIKSNTVISNGKFSKI